MAKAYWGVDVGKSSVKAVRMELKGGTPAITAVEVVAYPPSEGGDAAALDQRILDGLQELKGLCKFGTEPVIISLPGHSTFNRLIKLPPVEDEKIPEIVQYEAQSQIPFNIDEVIWDYQIIEREYAPGEEKEVILFAIKRDIVEGFLANIQPVGLNIEAIQFAPVALYNFLSYDQELGGAAIALDLGGENTDLVILDGSKFWIRNLPITGNDITKALQKAFNLPFGEAEKLKLKAGQSQQAQKIFNAIQPVLRDLVGEIHRSIGYYKSISKTAKFDRIILLGNATKTLNFQKFVSQSLSTMGNLPAARLAKLGKITADAIDPGEMNRHLGTLGAAIGLGLQGLGAAQNSVNLLPDAYKKRKEAKKKQPWIIAAVAVLYVTVILAAFFMSRSVSELEDIQKNAEKAQQKYQALKGQYEAAKNVGDIETGLRTVGSISSERDLVLRVVNALNRCLPRNGTLPPEKEKEMLWVVDWKTEEYERPQPKPADGTTPPPVKGLPLATARNLRIEIEVVIARRENFSDGNQFVVDTLLLPKDKTGILSELGLVDRKRGTGGGIGWDVTGPEEIARPVSSMWKPTPDDPEPTAEKKFWRFKIEILVPMGARDRAALLAPAAANP